MMHGHSPPENEADVRAALVEVLPAALPNWLQTRRWFADKGRGITGVAFEDLVVEAVDPDWFALAIVRIALRDGDTARYFLPIAWTRTAPAVEIIAAAQRAAADGVIVDATEMPWFPAWLIDALAGRGAWPGGGWQFTANPVLVASAQGITGALMRAEQSNTSLRYGDAMIVKLFRRLQPGPNPDQEMLQALAGVGFERVPPFAGAASWKASDGAEYPIALAQAFVPNAGDGWSWMLDRLRGVAAGNVAFVLNETSPEWLLGRRTGELHSALCQIATPAYRPQATSRAAIASDIGRTLASVDEVAILLRESEARLPDPPRSRLPAIITGLHEIAHLAEGYRDEASTWRIRVHGDFHLGQTLRTTDGDWMLIDFEGEPARPVAERRQKASALKDVAGMLRSFAYARGAAERALGPPSAPDSLDRLADWEHAAREAFLAGYRKAIGSAPIPLAPLGDRAFRGALAAWELDKALYEIAYEVRNRPDWIELPLRSLLPALAD